MKLSDFSFPCLIFSRPKSPSSFFCSDTSSPSISLGSPIIDSPLDSIRHEFDPTNSKIYAYYWKPLSLHHLEYNEIRRRNCMDFFFETSNLLASQTTIEQLDKIDLRLVYLSSEAEQKALVLPWRSAVIYMMRHSDSLMPERWTCFIPTDALKNKETKRPWRVGCIHCHEPTFWSQDDISIHQCTAHNFNTGYLNMDYWLDTSDPRFQDGSIAPEVDAAVGTVRTRIHRPRSSTAALGRTTNVNDSGEITVRLVEVRSG